MTPLFSSTIRVDCPDGPRYILKHPEKAFTIAFPEWDLRVKTLVKFFDGSEARVDPKILKKTKSIVEKLTENYAALQAHYQAAYFGWWGNPCSAEAEKAFNDAKTKICEKEYALKELEKATSRLTDKIEARKMARKKGGKPKMAHREDAERRPPTKEKIPVPEIVFENIEKLVSKLKI